MEVYAGPTLPVHFLNTDRSCGYLKSLDTVVIFLYHYNFKPNLDVSTHLRVGLPPCFSELNWNYLQHSLTLQFTGFSWIFPIFFGYLWWMFSVIKTQNRLSPQWHNVATFIWPGKDNIICENKTIKKQLPYYPNPKISWENQRMILW